MNSWGDMMIGKKEKIEEVSITWLHLINLFGFLSKVAIFALMMYIPRHFGVHVDGALSALIIAIAGVISISSAYKWGAIGGLLFGLSTTSWLPLAYYTAMRFIGFILYYKTIAFIGGIEKWLKEPETKIPKKALEPPEEKILE